MILVSMSLKRNGKLVERSMKKTLYVKLRGCRYSLPCHGYCDECVVRFRCYTTKDWGLDVTEKESLLCRDKENRVYEFSRN